MIRKTVVALSMAALAAAGPVSAQENATFTMRSGDRQAGQLIDLGGGGFAVRINGQDRQVPTGDVAVIDFTGGGTSQADWDRLNTSGPFVALRDGQMINGQLADVGGTSPLRLSFTVNGANRDFQSNDVARIVLARPSNVPVTAPPLTDGGTITPGAILVPARQRWTATGLSVQRGEVLTVNSTGEIRFGAGENDRAPVGGSGQQSNENPVRTSTTGTLIARVGNGQPFAIGSQTSVQMPAAGQLFLGVNDTHLDDNDGSFQVRIQRGAVARPRR